VAWLHVRKSTVKLHVDGLLLYGTWCDAPLSCVLVVVFHKSNLSISWGKASKFHSTLDPLVRVLCALQAPGMQGCWVGDFAASWLRCHHCAAEYVCTQEQRMLQFVELHAACLRGVSE
jgi:hypothetical protein